MNTGFLPRPDENVFATVALVRPGETDITERTLLEIHK
jgi:hypothetical protein